MDKPKYTKAWLRAFYEDEGLSIDQIRARTGYSHGTVQRKLKEAGTHMRPVGHPLDELKERAALVLLAAGWAPADVGLVLELQSATIHRLTKEGIPCACCGDLLDIEPLPILCEQCAPTYTRYVDGTASCDHHDEDQRSNGMEPAGE